MITMGIELILLVAIIHSKHHSNSFQTWKRITTFLSLTNRFEGIMSVKTLI